MKEKDVRGLANGLTRCVQSGLVLYPIIQSNPNRYTCGICYCLVAVNNSIYIGQSAVVSGSSIHRRCLLVVSIISSMIGFTTQHNSNVSGICSMN